MKLKWTRRALNQLAEAQDYIAQDNPAAAEQVAGRIARSAEMLLGHPYMGRRGRVEGTREWVVGQTPYLLIYSLRDDTMYILRVIHAKQNWPPVKLRH